MSEVQGAEIASKKRKRTGKQREEAKKAAIQAKLLEQEVNTEAIEPLPTEEVNPAVEHEIISGGAETITPSRPNFDQIATRIPQALKSLHPIFKQAKTFEIRRLVKKIKFLRNKEGSKDELSDLEAQLALLSHIKLDPIISRHLSLRLAKHPLLKSQTIPPELTTLLTPKSDDAPSTSSSTQLVGKVENRLCSSKQVSEGIKGIISWTIGEEGAKLGKKVPTRKQAETPDKTIRVKSSHGRDEDGDLDGVHASASKAPLKALYANLPDMEDEDDVDDDELARQNVAADEAGWESGSISGGGDDSEDDVQGLAIAPPSSAGGSDSEAEELPHKRSKQQSKPSKPAKTQKTKVAPAPTGPITSSTFLPSLSTGFTLGDSDSDPDLDPDVDGAGLVGKQGAERKNRRGQRARQAIWEKKYGKNAKHNQLAREAEEKAQKEARFGKSDVGWGARGAGGGTMGAGGRGDFSGAGRGGASVGNGAGIARPAAPTLPAAAAHTPPTTTSQTALHPSWEAARLRKQREMAAASKATKIVFD